tara:strand:+ start:257 stop:364 length:108 start_codon:yes stop_codon:yes gene_type:complete
VVVVDTKNQRQVVVELELLVVTERVTELVEQVEQV